MFNCHFTNSQQITCTSHKNTWISFDLQQDSIRCTTREEHRKDKEEERGEEIVASVGGIKS
jgi:hypothetical protein